MTDLHTTYRQSNTLRRLLDAWDVRISSEGPLALHRWATLAVWPGARSATVAGSIGIEGNPLSAEQVAEVLAGGNVTARPADIRDVRNYNRALEVANRAALRPDFEWTGELLRRLNAAILSGLDDDELGEYRSQPVTVGGIYEPPDHLVVPALMDALVEWLRHDVGEHTLIRAGLAHLNVVSIHPWLNGNGRAARVVGSLVLMRHGVAAPELVNIESVIRANRDAYVAVLQETHGPAYQPDHHSATAWLEYFAGLSVDRLELRTRLDAAIQYDIGLLAMELDRASNPIDWVPFLLAARVGPVRTAEVSARLNLSPSRARAMLGEAVAAGWLSPQGEKRGRRYRAGDRLAALAIRTTEVMDRMRRGLPLDDS